MLKKDGQQKHAERERINKITGKKEGEKRRMTWKKRKFDVIYIVEFIHVS